MRDELRAASQWEGPFAVACITETGGSSPRPAGSLMLIGSSGRTVGSISSGCLEAVVAEAGKKVLASGEPQTLVFEAVTPDEVWRIGLTCGGRLTVRVLPGGDRAIWEEAYRLLLQRIPFSVSEALQLGELHAPEALFRVPAAPRLLVIGAVPIARSLLGFAREVGFETVLADPRAAFLQDSAALADHSLSEWPEVVLREFPPEPNAYVVLLTHDPKIDLPALRLLLRSPVAYIGALGSRKTHAQRLDTLREEGFSAEELARIRGPVGLAIGAKSPAEIALSIMAEIVQTYRGAPAAG